MNESYVLTLRARIDLAEIRERTASDSGPDRAAAVLDRFTRAFELLAEQPGIGHVREDLTDEPMLRFWRVLSYLIVYSRGTPWVEPLVILRVLHGARDPRMFRSKPGP